MKSFSSLLCLEVPTFCLHSLAGSFISKVNNKQSVIKRHDTQKIIINYTNRNPSVGKKAARESFCCFSHPNCFDAYQFSLPQHGSINWFRNIEPTETTSHEMKNVRDSKRFMVICEAIDESMGSERLSFPSLCYRFVSSGKNINDNLIFIVIMLMSALVFIMRVQFWD